MYNNTAIRVMTSTELCWVASLLLWLRYLVGYPGTFGYYTGSPGNTRVAYWWVDGYPLTVHGRQRAY